MLKSAFQRLTILVALLLTGFSASVDAARPNVVFILLDDLGYGDFQCYNPQGKIPTPHVNELAQQGMMFRDAHSPSAVCTPTRYALLTGRYAWRTRLQVSVLGGLSQPLIEPDRLTVGKFLQQQGYHTACIGKWHLGMGWQAPPGRTLPELTIETPAQSQWPTYDAPIQRGPTTNGFDEFFGISGTLDMVPYAYIRNDRVTSLPTGVHSWPMVLKEPGRDTRPGPAAAGFDPVRVMADTTREATEYLQRRASQARAGDPFFLYLAYASPHTPILPEETWRGKTGINPYADFVAQNDAAIGAVLKKLDELVLTKDTLVILASDNGCSPEANFEQLEKAGHHPSAPWRGMKADIFEGGHRVPCIARWPSVIAPGTTSDQLVNLSDFMATMAEIVNVPMPAESAVDSISFLPALKGEKRTNLRADAIHHSIDGSFAIRQGDWKLCICPGSGGWSSPRLGIDDLSGQPAVQLFNLKDDPQEKVNRIRDEEPRAQELFKLLTQQVQQGRSTPGPAQQNAVDVNLWKFMRR